ncbi:beclin 1-associated autophagy-related key regulator-like isoform X2 [Plodia interpunctella]|uniref:beclin 1-associated autophagy-related key regulator-like isoform X2 n=1 Tax=Plodia interpunctella TaxID=58824 RepID=UPI0023674E47|nr:beclin 1-associated autophagy-related key regulator-like isoform X2 [Plodia interpunctella]
MALSYLSEGEAPRDFRVSSTESDGHYTKCLLCYTVKRNFYCTECVKTGSFVHSSMPYSDRFSEKQAKLHRLKVNRQHVLDRCEKLLSSKIKKDTLLTEAKLARDKIDLLKLAIEQRRSNIDAKKKELLDLKHYNEELKLKLPRYQKRVASLGKHSQEQKLELHHRMARYTDQGAALGALRRSRIRQLIKYIFPVYMTYDVSDSIEDLEFVGDEWEAEPPKRSQLHIVAPWINSDLDCAAIEAWLTENKDADAEHAGAPSASALLRTRAVLALAAQLVALLAWTLDIRLPHAIPLHEYLNWRESEGGARWRARRVCACAGALCTRGALPPSLPSPLAGLHALALAATTDEHSLGRVEGWLSASVVSAGEAWAAALGARALADDDEPEHLSWPETLEVTDIDENGILRDKNASVTYCPII